MQTTKFSLSQIAVFGVLALSASLSPSQQNRAFPETGTVKLLVSGEGTLKSTEYMITSDRAIYRVLCTHFKDKAWDPDCSFNGKTIADGDTIQFRIDGEMLILPLGEQRKEQVLPILGTELNPYPQKPAPGKNGVENGIVVAVGNYKNEQYLGELLRKQCASRPTDNSRSSVPKAMPLTSPVGGNPSAGDVIGYATATTAEQSNDLLCRTSRGSPLDSFKLITSDLVYEVLCTSAGPCQVNGQPLRLGETYFVRIDRPNMRIATDPGKFSDGSDFHVISGLYYSGNQSR